MVPYERKSKAEKIIEAPAPVEVALVQDDIKAIAQAVLTKRKK